MNDAFGAMLCIWTTPQFRSRRMSCGLGRRSSWQLGVLGRQLFPLAEAVMKQQMNVKLMKWGMGENASAVTPVRKNFKDRLQRLK